MKRYEAIFQIQSNGEWLDYVRSTVGRPDEAITVAIGMARVEGRRFRVRVEDWGDEVPRDPPIFYGDWDTSKLSLAHQQTGVFKPLAY